MKSVVVSSKGQVAIPKAMRADLNINEGDTLSVSVENGKLILEPAVNIPFSLSWFCKPEIQQRIASAHENFKTGNYSQYTIDEFIEILEKKIGTD
ncbi:MAG: AbrB/MazE/SpoVT family DNA-binding domain-containing protein [Nitrospirae bacterium]|nr:AbrB/MazE/SpoVT family DNA-binding domain-containing protein [Nitrospirota bacterium]MBF0535094.1 AbrB/MazE/SpoVT family DNA-binding domain-containing protein [Nitrospirota bacterium]MBF0615356.1 AbrB/MazE/SpoVT family DNA-binding domain-containing protein [Nitrospirota bacterium]